MKRTKLLAVLAAIVMLASAPTALASASTAWTGTVRVSTSLNVRTAGKKLRAILAPGTRKIAVRRLYNNGGIAAKTRF